MRKLSDADRQLIRAARNNDIAFILQHKELKEQIVELQRLMCAYHKVGDMLAKACRKASILSLDQYSKIVQSFPKVFHELLFENYERDCYAKEFTYDWDEERWSSCISEMYKLKLEITCMY